VIHVIASSFAPMMAETPPILIPGLFLDCAGGCGVLVRQDAEKRLCDKCLDLDRLYAARLLRDRLIQSSTTARILRGEDERIDVGCVAHQPGDVCLLDDNRLSWRERAALLVLSVGSVLAAGWIAYIGWIGIRISIALMLRGGN